MSIYDDLLGGDEITIRPWPSLSLAAQVAVSRETSERSAAELVEQTADDHAA